MDSGLDNLERELREWRENRSRAMADAVADRDKMFRRPAGRRGGNRRVHVNGQEVVVVSKSKRP